ncbi:MAG: Unknown protein [uncultured Sulfurovum sp.]|uniref:Uncharacterized protein n=1 Tax=uncultured Sulfurovum sp. TaxID=269237 RepID=A0A6S6T789_9BACT|nr:MAG: Unknown protein [uncultured Sulfurovum sp.]
MEQLLPAYDDPLFSILLIIVLGLIIAVATYGWGIYKQQKEEGNLLKFLDKFDSSECTLNTQDMPYEEHLLKPLSLLAKAFENTGEYHKSISIYLYLIKNIKDDLAKIELLERLGNTYLHAGFLERARTIYIDILRKRPRNKPVLYELCVVYEMMQKYEKAREVIEPLEYLNQETQDLRTFLDFSEIKHNKKIDTTKKVYLLQQLLNKEPKLYRAVIYKLFKLDTKVAWESVDPSRIHEILDILWFLPQAQVDFEIVKENPQLNTLYYAKGYVQTLPNTSGIFALDMLATAKKQGFEEADLHFSYLCKKCKQSFPISFSRCPNCMAIYSIEVKEDIGKQSPQTNYSLL